jgi:hypothetical protein
MQSTFERVPTMSGTGSAFFGKWNNAFLAAVFLVGTGGVATPRTINYVPSGMLQVRIPRGSDGNIDSDRMLDVQEKLAGIQRYLSMTVSDLAKVLRVGRPTVYSWLRDEASLRGEHTQRLEVIYKMAREWRAMSNRPVGSFLNQPATSGDTLLTLLSARMIDRPAVQSAFSEIRVASSRTPRRPNVMDLAKKRGFKLAITQQPTTWRSDEDFDI